PPRQKKYGRKFCNLRRLKPNRSESDPPARAVDPHANVGNVAKQQRHGCDPDPNPPGSLPEMVIDQRRRDADSEPDSKPDRLVFKKKIRIAVAVFRESASAEKHYDADDEEPKHRNKKEVSAFPVHYITGSSLTFFPGAKAFVRSLIYAGRRCD